jgi:hypothetical protein
MLACNGGCRGADFGGATSDAREAFDPSLRCLVADFDRLNLQEFRLRFFLRGLGLLDLTGKLRNRAF